MLRDKDYYEILGVSKSATKNDIDKAYRAKVMQYHPDVYKGNDADVKMKEINKAYEVLSDSEKRSQYDNYLTSGYDTKDFDYYDDEGTDGFQQQKFRDDSGFFSQFSFNFGGGNSGDFDFKNMFSNFFGRSNESNYSGNNYDNGYTQRDVNISIELTIQEWFMGTTKTIAYDIEEKCSQCIIQRVQCTSCNGRGYIDATLYGRVVCNSCGGSKYVEALKLCGKCNRGVNKKRTSSTFKITRFMNKKYVLKKGGNFNPSTQSYGNLNIEIKILEHPHFELSDNNVICNIGIGIEEYIYGTKIKFKYVDNSYVNLNIPPISDLKVIIKKKGAITNNQTGDLIINLYIQNNMYGKITQEQFNTLFKIVPIKDNFVERK